MKVGSIFKWGEYEKRADKRVSGRLFIYFGRSPSFIDPIYAYIATTTAKTAYYKNGGKYCNNRIIWFVKDECNFDKECVLDFDRYFYWNLELNRIIDKKVVSIISTEKLKFIYSKIYDYKKIRIDIRNNIYDCFNRNQITGLKRPK